MSISQSQKNVVETNPSAAANQLKSNQPMFGPKNYALMAIGVALMVLGYVLMVGGSSDANPEVFNADEKYGTIRITVAPILILLGLVIQIPAILLRAK